MKRVKTHIQGFDELIEGGFVEGSTNLVVGSSGTGKTIFSLEYIYNGCKKEKEIGIYFTFEEKRDDLINQARQFGWDLESLEKKGKLKIISLGFEDISKNTTKEIMEIVNGVKAKRIVIDSISTLAYLTPNKSCDKHSCELETKKFVYLFIAKLRELKGVTTLLISQKDKGGIRTIAEYLCEGIVNIKYETLGGNFSRNMTVRKMRKTKNNEDLHPMEISNKGIIIHNLD